MAKFFNIWPRFAVNMSPRRGRQPRLARRFDSAVAWISVVIVLGVLVLAISPAPMLRRLHIEAGDRWVEPDLASPFRVTVVDQAHANAERRLINERHVKVFGVNPEVEAGSSEAVDRLLAAAQQAADVATSPSDFQKDVQRRFGLDLEKQTAEILLAHAGDPRLRSDLHATLRNVYGERGVTDDAKLLVGASRAGRLALVSAHGKGEISTTFTAESVLEYPREALVYIDEECVAPLPVPDGWKAAYLDIAGKLLRPNVVFDATRTRDLRDRALQQAGRQVVVEAGTLVVSRGDRLTPLQAAVLKRLGMELRWHNVLKTLGNGFFAALAVAFMILYARKYNPDLSFTARNVFMVALPVVFALCAGRFILNVGGQVYPGIAAYAFPAGMVGMLGVILFDARFGIMLVVLASMLFGIASGMNYSFILVSLVGGFTGVASLYTIKERKEVLLAGVRLAAVNFIAILAVNIVQHPESIDLGPAIGGIVNGFACYALAVGALPLFETLFRVTTDVRLMELTSTNHPLLRMMEEKAPGSYQHVLNVTKLAEPAAEAIGANFLLVRAGAYFHDIGKMLKPKYFTENQVTPDERKIHSRLSPFMSNLVIKNHVKEGIELARKHNLPEKVIDFIPQHHGTGLIRYFYDQAVLKAESDDEVPMEEFRYPGPKPQTLEAAIVMLADSVDATATAKFTGRTIKEEEVRKVVHDTVLAKFNDDQFDECHMLFRDLHQIRDAFVRALLSRYHQRIDYPQIGTKREVKDITFADQPSPEPAQV